MSDDISQGSKMAKIILTIQKFPHYSINIGERGVSWNVGERTYEKVSKNNLSLVKELHSLAV